jgi:hypothetical protein
MDIAFIEQKVLDKKEHMNISTAFSGSSNLILAIVAVYLCWTRNTMQNETLVLKIVYCIIAFFAPLIYIIYYAATRKLRCSA